jgi:hypothetical protein
MGSNGMQSGLIELRCLQRDHQAAGKGASPVFLKDGAWAYCEAGKLARDHQFIPTGGLSRQRIEGKRTVGHG